MLGDPRPAAWTAGVMARIVSTSSGDVSAEPGVDDLELTEKALVAGVIS